MTDFGDNFPSNSKSSQDNFAHTADKDSTNPLPSDITSSSTSSTSSTSSVTTAISRRPSQLRLDTNFISYQIDDSWIEHTDTPFPSPPYVYTPLPTLPFTNTSYFPPLPVSVVPHHDCSPPYVPSYLHSRVDEMIENKEIISVFFPTGWGRGSEYIKVSDNGLRITYNGPGGSIWTDAAAIRTNYSIPREIGLYYYEMTLLDKGSRGNIGLGLAEEFNPYDRMPGWDYYSIGYHGDDGLFFTNSTEGTDYGPLYTAGDTVGCGINFFDDSVFFTKNGMNLGNAIKNCVLDGPLYPIIGLISKNECVEANFGANPFEYDIMMHAKMVFQEAKMLGKKVEPDRVIHSEDLSLLDVFPY